MSLIRTQPNYSLRILFNLETMVVEALLPGFIIVLFDRMVSKDVILNFFRGKPEVVKLLEELKIKLLSVGASLDDVEEK